MGLGSNVVRRLSFIVGVENRASAQLAAIDATAGGTASSMTRAAASARLLMTAIKGVGAAAAASAVSVGLIARQGARLSSSMATIEATTNATAGQMQMLREEIIRVGSDTPASILETADAFKQLSYAGFEMQEIMASGMDVVELAVAGQLEMGEAAKIVAQSLNAYNMEAEQAGAVSDTLAAVFASSQTEIRELANGLSYVNATASQLGFSLNETAAAIGVLSDNSIAGTRAGTSLNQALSKLFAQTGKVQDALSAAGLSMDDFTDSEGNAKSMVEILRVLRDRMEELNMGSAGRQAWLTDLFGRRGARAMAPLLENIEDLEEKQKDAGLAELKSQIEGIRQEVSDMDGNELARALFGDNQTAEDMLSDAPSNKDVISALRERYGTGEAAGDQIQAALMNAFPEMSRAAAKETAEMISQSSITMEEYAERMGVTEEKAREMAAGLSETEMIIQSTNQAMSDATTDQDIYQEFMDTVGGKVEDLTGDIGALADQMFLGMAPALTTTLDLLKDVTGWLGEHESALRVAGKAMFYFAAATSAVTIALIGMYAKVKLGMLAAGIPTLWRASGAANAAAAGFRRLGLAAGATTSAAALSNHALAEFGDDAMVAASQTDEATGAFARLKKAGGGLLTRFRNLGPSWAALRTSLVKGARSARGAFFRLGSIASWALLGIGDAAIYALKNAKGFFKAIPGLVRGGAVRAILGFTNVFARIGGLALWATGAFKALPGVLLAVAKAALNPLNIFYGLMGVLSGTGGILTAIGGAITGVVTALNPLAWVVLAVAGAFAAWQMDLFGAREELQPLVDALGNALSGVVEFGQAVWRWGVWALTGLWDTIEGSPAEDFFVGLGELAFDALGVVARGLAWVINGLVTLARVGGGAIHGFGETVWDFMHDPLGEVKDAVQWLINKIPNIPEPPDWATKLFGGGGGNQQQQPPSDRGGRVESQQGDGTPSDVRRDRWEGEGLNETRAGERLDETLADLPDPEEYRKRGEAQERERAKGIREGQKYTTRATKESTEKSAEYLPSSNAKRGPLSDLTTRGAAMLKTFAKGMRREQHAVGGAASSAMGRIAKRLGPDGLRDKSKKTFKKVADAIERTDDPLAHANEQLETLYDWTNDVVEVLRGFENWTLDLTGQLDPLDLLQGALDWVGTKADRALDWLSGIDSFDINLDPQIKAFENLGASIQAQIEKAQDLADELKSLGPRKDDEDDSDSDGSDSDTDTTDESDSSNGRSPGQTSGGASGSANAGGDTAVTGGIGGGAGGARDSSIYSRGGGGGIGLGPDGPMSVALNQSALLAPMQDGQQGQQASSDGESDQTPTGPHRTRGRSDGQQDGESSQQRAGRESNVQRQARKQRVEELAAMRAEQTAQTVMPRAFNAVRSDLIPSFVPTMSDSSTSTDTSTTTPTGDTSGDSTDLLNEVNGSEGEGDTADDGTGNEVPQMASGGVVTDDTLANIGEGNEDEAVLPLSRLEQMLSVAAGAGAGGPSGDITINEGDIHIDNANGSTRQLRADLRRELDAQRDELLEELAAVLRRDTRSVS